MFNQLAHVASNPFILEIINSLIFVNLSSPAETTEELIGMPYGSNYGDVNKIWKQVFVPSFFFFFFCLV